MRNSQEPIKDPYNTVTGESSLFHHCQGKEKTLYLCFCAFWISGATHEKLSKMQNKLILSWCKSRMSSDEVTFGTETVYLFGLQSIAGLYGNPT